MAKKSITTTATAPVTPPLYSAAHILRWLFCVMSMSAEAYLHADPSINEEIPAIEVAYQTVALIDSWTFYNLHPQAKELFGWCRTLAAKISCAEHTVPTEIRSLAVAGIFAAEDLLLVCREPDFLTAA